MDVAVYKIYWILILRLVHFIYVIAQLKIINDEQEKICFKSWVLFHHETLLIYSLLSV